MRLGPGHFALAALAAGAAHAGVAALIGLGAASPGADGAREGGAALVLSLADGPESALAAPAPAAPPPAAPALAAQAPAPQAAPAPAVAPSPARPAPIPAAQAAPAPAAAPTVVAAPPLAEAPRPAARPARRPNAAAEAAAAASDRARDRAAPGASPPFPAAPSTAPASPGGAAASAAAPENARAPAEARRAYLSRLQAALAAGQRYPEGARRRGAQGTGALRFTVTADGAVEGARLARGSNHADLDAEMLAMLKRVAPLPPLPPELGARTLDVTLPVAFSLR